MNLKPLSFLKGVASVIAYHAAERIEKRDISSKVRELRRYYKTDFLERKKTEGQRLRDICAFAQARVPYYRDLFQKISFDPEKLLTDSSYIEALPFLTKEIVNAQGDRLLAQSLEGIRYYDMKTGGSTGPSAHFFYNQNAADYSSAVTLYCRERVGKIKRRSATHFAASFPDAPAVNKSWTREDWKCLAMNRSNIFVGALSEDELDGICTSLQKLSPYLVHAHPSTIFTLACHIESNQRIAPRFAVFEPSGELLTEVMRTKIQNIFQCRIANRYGLAEFGVVAYEFLDSRLQILDSEVYPESIEVDEANVKHNELVFTSFRNHLMPLLRYRTGDLGQLEIKQDGYILSSMMGRVHDLVLLGEKQYLTHYIMDILDHRVGDIEEFQIDSRGKKPRLLIVPKSHANCEEIRNKINKFLGNDFGIDFVKLNQLIRIGRHQKFRHVVRN
jgi:phenylacetate-CoA ligase